MIFFLKWLCSVCIHSGNYLELHAVFSLILNLTFIQVSPLLTRN